MLLLWGPTQGNYSFTRDANGNILTSTDELGNTATLTYDPVFSKVTSITDPLGNVSQLAYDAHGNMLTFTDPNHNTTAFAYNSFGQVTQISDPVGQKTSFSYDSLGNLLTVEDALGNVTTIVYDAIAAYPNYRSLGRRTEAVYDALSRITSQTDAQGNVTQFGYDGVGNLTSLNGRSVTTRLCSLMMARTAFLLERRRWAAPTPDLRLQRQLNQLQGSPGTDSSFTYDVLNRLTGEAYVDSTVARFYDANSRLVGVNDSASGVFGFAYDAIGRLLDSVTPMGEIQYAYDAASRIQSREVVGQAALAIFLTTPRGIS